MAKSVTLCKEACQRAPERLDFQTLAVEAMAYYAYFCLSGDTQQKTIGKATLDETLTLARKLNSHPEVPMAGRLALAFTLNVTSVYHLSENNLDQCRTGLKKLALFWTRSSHGPLPTRVEQTTTCTSAPCRHLTWAVRSPIGQVCWKRWMKTFNEGVEQLRNLIRIHPQALVYKLQLLQAFRAKAVSLTAQGKAEEANIVNQESNALLQQMVQENPNQAWLQTLGVANTSVQLVERVRSGNLDGFPGEAEHMLSNVRASNRDTIMYNVACAYSVATSLPSLDDPTRSKYKQRAIELLKQLGSYGYFKDEKIRAHSQSDSDLKPIASEIHWETIFNQP